MEQQETGLVVNTVDLCLAHTKLLYKALADLVFMLPSQHREQQAPQQELS
jgi:hypothetical protein